MTLLWVALLGALGSAGRYLLGGAVQRWCGPRFPFGTLAVNLLGSVAIGAVMTIYAARHGLESRSRIALTAGLLGGFTTYSSFAYETVRLVLEGHLGFGALNFAVTSAVCFAGCAGGVALVGFALTR
jgi:CrcB protein